MVTHALRTPIGRFLGSLATLSAADLGTSVVADLLARAGIEPPAVDELVFGNARQAGGGPNPARQIAVRAGLPVERPAWTLNMACGSGLKAVAIAAEGIAAGRTEHTIASTLSANFRYAFRPASLFKSRVIQRLFRFDIKKK